MAEWDRFSIDNSGKSIVTTKLDVLELPSGTYFLNKEFIKKSRNYAPEDLKNGSTYTIYKMIAHTKDSRSGITNRVTDLETITAIVQEIKESLIK